MMQYNKIGWTAFEVKQSMQSMNIYLLRHGETDWNIEKRFQGQRDIPLNANGISQIEKSAEILAEMIDGVDHILTSPLCRAQKTAQTAADKLGFDKKNIEIAPLFIERAFGEGEGVAGDDLWDETVIAQFQGAETLDELCCRAQAALQMTAKEYSGKNVLVAAHGAILRAVLAAVLGRQFVYEEKKMKLESGCVHWLQYDSVSWKVYKCDLGEKQWKKI